jgi:putative transposase
MYSNGGSKSLRKARVSLVNHAYHITLVTQNSVKVFYDFKCARKIVIALKQSDLKGITETLSFCIMPDHVHWLFILKTDNLSRAVARVKSQYSKETKSKVWQDGFHDHLIRDDESLKGVARYIVANPVRAKLVNDVADYPHWDAVWL